MIRTPPSDTGVPASPVPSLATLRERLLPVCQKHGIVRVEIFGSFARGEAEPKSDLDLIIEFREADHIPSLFELGEIEADLSDAAKIKVQIMTKYSSLRIVNPFFAHSIANDRRELLKV